MNKYRTHNCSELSEEQIDKNVLLSGGYTERETIGNLLY